MFRKNKVLVFLYKDLFLFYLLKCSISTTHTFSNGCIAIKLNYNLLITLVEQYNYYIERDVKEKWNRFIAIQLTN